MRSNYLVAHREYMAAELTARQAAKVCGISHQTIWRRVKDGHLPARRQGITKIAYIDLDILREFAQEYNYNFDEELAAKLASG